MDWEFVWEFLEQRSYSRETSPDSTLERLREIVSWFTRVIYFVLLAVVTKDPHLHFLCMDQQVSLFPLIRFIYDID
jgi:hypothetical protein